MMSYSGDPFLVQEQAQSHVIGPDPIVNFHSFILQKGSWLFLFVVDLFR